MSRRILVSSALPYTTGAIHLGQLLEHIQTDIWVRFQKMRGHQCIYVCADDTHGTGTMLKAEELGTTAEALIENMRVEHAEAFRDFLVEHDNYYSTHSEENRELSELIYNRLHDRGLIFTEQVEQLFDNERQMFLADRFVQGICPRCGEPDQYGDNCEKCGATYDATELIEPVSRLSNQKPELKSSTHYFFDLGQYTAMLKDWTTGGAVQPEVANKLAEWLDAGLKPWDISRDAPYFGFLIPGTTDKYFYVWLDAPIGYMASFKHLTKTNNEIAFDDFWQAKNTTEVHHFIGKDIVNFHALFWPAVLDAAGFRKPTKIHTHGFITVGGTKMSKSRGTFINASTYLKHLDPEYLRYYYATKLGANIDDIDINLDDFVQRVNSDLVGKVVNIASRCAGFLAKQFDNKTTDTLHDAALWQRFVGAQDTLAAYFEDGEYAKAMREISALADLANQYIAQHEPWVQIKDPGKRELVHAVCSQGINLFRLLTLYLKPVLPKMAASAETYLNVDPLVWGAIEQPLLGHSLGKFKPLFLRMERKALDRVIADSAESITAGAAPAVPTAADTIDIKTFEKVSLKVAKIIDARAVPGADTLLQLTLDLGTEQRVVFAGIKAAYDPASLIGRLTVVVANLAPRKMKFGVSEGMVLAAGPGNKDIFLLSPDSGAQPGMDIR